MRLAARPRVDLAHLPQDDPAVYEMLQRGRHHRRVPGRVARADGDAAAAQADGVLRPRRAGGDHPARADRRADGASVSEPPRRARAGGATPHPSLEPILARTLGVPLFQEQLLRMAMVAAGFTGGQAEELRRAMGFKRSEQRMKQIEVQLREGMARNGITGDAAEQIVTSITSFALYGFPESHAASFALLAYASAYLKVHYPAAFYTALLNNQPMGFYHPVDAREGRAAPRRAVPSDRRAGVGLGLPGRGRRRDPARAALRQRPARGGRAGAIAGVRSRPRPHPSRGCRDHSQMRRPSSSTRVRLRRCLDARADRSRRTGSATSARTTGRVRRPRAARSARSTISSRAPACAATSSSTLADIGALNAFGYDRRSALWQAERAVRPVGRAVRQDEPRSTIQQRHARQIPSFRAGRVDR